MKIRTLIPLIAGVALLVGCGKQDEKKAAVAVEIPPVFVEKAISGSPTPIPEARTRFKAGDEILLTGLIMGVPHPFVEGRGVFVLGDEGTLTPCDLKEGDSCSMPWDVCCDPAAVRTAGTATIQIMGANGKLLRTSLNGVNGLSELSRVTVLGTVAANSSSQAFIVNASAIHIGVR